MKELSQSPHLWQMMAAILIFAAAYLLIAAERWNRTYVAIAGAGLMIVIGLVSVREAITTDISWNTLGLVAGLYVIAGFMNKTGIFQFAALSLIRWTQGKPILMLIILSSLAAIGAGLFDGILAILTLVPFTIGAARMLKISPVPFVITEILSANLGGMATLVGNLPNKLIGTSADLSFTHYLLVLGPLAFVLLALVVGITGIVYSKRFVIAEAYRKELLGLTPSDYLANRRLIVCGGLTVIWILLAFLLQDLFSISTGLIAIVGALLLLAVDYKEVLQTLKSRDYRQFWQVILDSQVLFIGGLFVMVGGLNHSGVTAFIATRMMEISQGSLAFSSILLLWLSGLGSAVLDAIPFVAAMLPVLKDMGVLLGLDTSHTDTLWWALALGAGIGGGGTLIGSPANLIAAGLSEQEGNSRISYGDYLRWAGPLTLLMLIIATLYLYFVLL
jgi:Na+/H+ antiporter NhaD/arsenite permease-like protein